MPPQNALTIPRDKESLKKMFDGLPENSTAKAFLQRRKNAATTKDVDEAITMALALTGVKAFTSLQWKYMRQELLKLGVSREEILKRARSVALNPAREFGSIGLQYWVMSTVLTTDTVDFAVGVKLRTILAEVELQVKHPDAQEVGQAAIDRLRFEYEEEYRSALLAETERLREETKKILKKLCARIEKMSAANKLKLYAQAVEAKIFFNDKQGNPDKFILANLHKSYIAIKLVGLPILAKRRTI